MTTLDERPPTRTVDDLDQPTRQWWTRAACRGSDSDTFLEESSEAAAKDICSACPVIRDCLLDAVRQPHDVSVRGGMTRAERRDWLRTQSIGAAAEFDRAAVQRMLDNDWTWDQIGAVHGMSGRTMQRRWERVGPPKPRQHGPSATAIDTTAARALLAQGMSQLKVAERLGTTHSTLRRALARDEHARSGS